MDFVDDLMSSIHDHLKMFHPTTSLRSDDRLVPSFWITNRPQLLQACPYRMNAMDIQEYQVSIAIASFVTTSSKSISLGICVRSGIEDLQIPAFVVLIRSPNHLNKSLVIRACLKSHSNHRLRRPSDTSCSCWVVPDQSWNSSTRPELYDFLKKQISFTYGFSRKHQNSRISRDKFVSFIYITHFPQVVWNSLK